MHTDSDSGVVRFGPFSLDPKTGDLYRNGSPVLLPPQPTRILCLLALHAGSIVSRSRISDELWDKAPPDPDQAINSAVAEIRSALDDDARDPEYIQTVPRKGYRLLVDPPDAGHSVEPAAKHTNITIGGPARTIAAFGFAAAVVLLAVWLLTAENRAIDTHRLLIVPTRVTAAAPHADALATRLTDRLTSGMTVSQLSHVEILLWQWDMKVDRDERMITRDGADLNIDFLIESSVDRGEEWAFSVSVYSVDDGTQLWYRMYRSPIDASGDTIEQIVNELDSVLIENLKRRSSRVD